MRLKALAERSNLIAEYSVAKLREVLPAHGIRYLRLTIAQWLRPLGSGDFALREASGEPRDDINVDGGEGVEEGDSGLNYLRGGT